MPHFYREGDWSGERIGGWRLKSQTGSKDHYVARLGRPGTLVQRRRGVWQQRVLAVQSSLQCIDDSERSAMAVSEFAPGLLPHKGIRNADKRCPSPVLLLCSGQHTIFRSRLTPESDPLRQVSF